MQFDALARSRRISIYPKPATEDLKLQIIFEGLNSQGRYSPTRAAICG